MADLAIAGVELRLEHAQEVGRRMPPVARPRGDEVIDLRTALEASDA
jgi:hypothetical protein